MASSQGSSITDRERKWLAQVAKEHLPAEYLSANGGVMAALSEVLSRTKEACAKHIDNLVSRHATESDSKANWLIARVQDEAAHAIRNLEITGE